MSGDVFSMFTELSGDFDRKYGRDRNFEERFTCWSEIIDSHLKSGQRVYDLGCGPGVFSFYCASRGAEVTGIDGSEGMVRLCNEKREAIPPSVQQHLRFTRDVLPLERTALEPADMVVCSSVFEYVKNKEGMLKGFQSLLKPGGVLLVSVPNKRSVYRILEKFSFMLFKRPLYLAHVFHRSDYSEMAAEFSRYGFEPLEHRYYAGSYRFSGLLKRVLGKRYYCNLLLVSFRKK